MKNIFIIYHGRFPGEKAAALFAAKEAGSLVPYGAVILVAPRRLARERQEPHAYFGISNAVRVVYLPILDLFEVPLLRHAAFLVSYVSFTLSCFVYFALRVGSNDVVITNEPLPALAATCFSRKAVIEVHDFPERWHALYALLFKRAHTVLCTNGWKREALAKKFAIPAHKLFVERNAVDVAAFGGISKQDARAKLGLPQDIPLMVYTGHLYEHKGGETLAEAAAQLPEVTVAFVGGTKADVATFTKRWGTYKNIRVVGQRPHQEMPLWQAAADVLVLPNSAQEAISARYTSPMKLFEYMASNRPIVASSVSAIAEVLPQDAGYFATPDAPDDLAAQIRRALAEPAEAAAKAARARALVLEHSWEKRAERLMKRFA